MSLPPRPHFRTSTTGPQEGRRDRLDYLPAEFADLVCLQQQLTAEETGLTTSGAEGDFAYTLIQLSALLGHILGAYQDLYAQEAFLGTAQSAKSLVRHARRLAYQPDTGLAATGYAVLTVADGLSGRLPAGFGLASAPRGEVKAQDYETLDDLDVDARWNEARPTQPTRDAVVSFDAAGRATVVLQGTGYSLVPGERAVLVGPKASHCLPLRLDHVEEDGEAGVTRVRLSGGTSRLSITLRPYQPDTPAAGYRLLARPALTLRPFGWDANLVQFPPDQLRTQGAYTAPLTTATTGTVHYGYQVRTDSGATYSANDVYLSEAVAEPLLDTWLLHVAARTATLYRVAVPRLATVAFTRGEVVAFPQPLFHDDGRPQRNDDGTIKTQDRKQLLESQVTGTVTVVRLQPPRDKAVARTTLAFPSTFLAGWRVAAPLVDSVPNRAPATQPVTFAADLSGLKPGRFVVLTTLDETTSQVAEVRKLQVLSRAGGPATTQLWWHERTPLPPGHTWTLGNLKVFANVGRISHGRTRSEVLGDSDGVTPFLRFPLKQSPVTMLPGPDGGEPALEVRVQDVLWTRVRDFHDSTPEDRHYRLEIDHEQRATVVFGDGRHSAIPPSGKKHIRAVYRIDLGPAGNADPGAVSRVKKAHPLVDRASNPTRVHGGAAPAGAADVRRQATRYLRTFDRAVSVQDHADLALLYPGVARAAAQWDDAAGVRLVAATAEGLGFEARDQLEAFLNERRDATIPLTLLDPEPVDVYMTVTVEHAPAFLSENVRSAVQDALFGADPQRPGLFTFAARSFGQAAHLSEVHARVAAVEGVEFARVSRFALSDAENVHDVLQAALAQWLRLRPENCLVQATPKGDAP
jgi:hypothetical protein